MQTSRWRRVLLWSAGIAALAGFLHYTDGADARRWKTVPSDFGLIRTAAYTGGPIAGELRDRTRFVSIGYQPGTEPEGIEALDLPDAPEGPVPLEFVTLTRVNGGHMILADRESKRDGAARRLARHLGWRYKRSSLRFDAADIVPGRTHVFISSRTIRANEGLLARSDDKITQRFEREFGRPVIVLDLPSEDIRLEDVFASLDEESVMMADLSWGMRIRDEETSQRDIRAVAEGLDSLSRELEKQGFRVWRVPLLPGDDEDGRPHLSTGIFTYTNVLIETMGDRRTVYLPHYGLGAADEAASKAWSSTGFNVIPVDCEPGSSLRSAVRVLSRE